MKTPGFAGKVAAISGAGSGIGRGLALALASRGCALSLCDLDEAGLAETAGLCGSSVKVTTRRVDVSAQADVTAWAEEAAKEHGRINLVFNNAGISYGATIAGGDDADFRRVVEVNFFGVVYGTRAFLPHLEASGDGHVVNISSVFGIVGFPGQAAYNATKFAVRGFTESLIIELLMTGSNVGATCVHPGGVKTGIAKATKIHDSMQTLGASADKISSTMQRLLTMQPARAAEIILTGVARNKRRVLVGSDAKVLDVMQRLLPGSYHGLIARNVKKELGA